MVYGGKFSLTKAKVNPFIVQTLSFLKDGVLGVSEMCDYLCTILLDLSEVFTTLCDFILSRIRVLGMTGSSSNALSAAAVVTNSCAAAPAAPAPVDDVPTPATTGALAT